MMRVHMEVDVDALTEAEAFAIIEKRLRVVECGHVEFIDCTEIDDTPGDSHLLESSGGGASYDYRESWRHGS